MRHTFTGIAIVLIVVLQLATSSWPVLRRPGAVPSVPPPVAESPSAMPYTLRFLDDDGSGLTAVTMDFPDHWIPVSPEILCIESAPVAAVKFFPNGTIVVVYAVEFGDGTPLIRVFRMPTKDDIL